MDSGHYFSIISNRREVAPGEPVRWFRFDDRDVTEFDPKHLDEKHPKFIGEAYMLFYDRIIPETSASSSSSSSSSSTPQQAAAPTGAADTSASGRALLAASTDGPTQHKPVSKKVGEEIMKLNAEMLGKRLFQSPEYFGFLKHLFEHAPEFQPVEVGRLIDLIDLID